MDNCVEEGKENRSIDPRIPDFVTKNWWYIPSQLASILLSASCAGWHHPAPWHNSQFTSALWPLDCFSWCTWRYIISCSLAEKPTDGCLPRYFGRLVINDTHVAVGSDITSKEELHSRNQDLYQQSLYLGWYFLFCLGWYFSRYATLASLCCHVIIDFIYLSSFPPGILCVYVCISRTAAHETG